MNILADDGNAFATANSRLPHDFTWKAATDSLIPMGTETNPIILQGENAAFLEHVEFDDKFRDEDWLQDLLFKHSQLIPFEKIEPACAKSVPIAREVPVQFESGSGSIDLVFCNPNGYLTLVETKLWRNPESRRAVVSQLIGYASQIAKMGYEEFSKAIDATSAEEPNVLINTLRDRCEDFDPRHFHDALSVNLRRGKFLLLIIGDGIREDVDSMAEFLQGQPHLGFTLALIEMAMFRLRAGRNDEILVQPRIASKTREVVRAVVEVRGTADAVLVRTPVQQERDTSPRRFTLTAEDFYEKLSQHVDAGTVDFARWVVANMKDHQLSVDWKQAGPVFKYVDAEHDVFFTLFQLHKEGEISEIFRFRARCEELGLPEQIWRDYFEATARLIPGATIETYKYGEDVAWDSERPSLVEIASKKSEWLAAVDLAVKRVRDWLGKQKK